jgi:SAM-dependent methyltransferase
MPPSPTYVPPPHLRDDFAFDAVYPEHVRRVSRRFWTPVGIARRAAELLRDAGVKRVLDVGSGVGKFALVAASTAPELDFVGVEQREHLFATASAAREALGLTNVRFVLGDAGDVAWSDFDGFYFYNSFAENLFDPDDRLDDRAELSMARFARDVQRTTTSLRAARVGTAVATFYGSSGRIPASFELSHQEAAGSGFLRLWTRVSVADDGGFYVEDGPGIVKYDAAGRYA